MVRNRSGQHTAVMVLLSLTISADLSAGAHGPPFVSAYTELTGCKVIERSTGGDEGPDYFHERCPGRNGYTVDVFGADTRTWLVLRKGSARTIDLQGLGGAEFYFPIVAGKRLEWRYRATDGGPTLIGLILRMGGNPREVYDRGDVHATGSRLYAIRIAGDRHCVLGSAVTNAAARQLADSPQACQ